MEKQAVVVFWFRRDLRLSDNVGLFHALSSDYPVLPLFIFDKNILGKLNDRKDKRITFIHDALWKLQAELLKAGSSLFILHDEPLAAFATLCSMFDVKKVFTNNDHEPYGIARDKKVSDYLDSTGIGFFGHKDHLVHESRGIHKEDLTPYTVFTPYSKKWKEGLGMRRLNTCLSEYLTVKFLKTNAFPFPSLEELGFRKADLTFPPNVIDRALISNYDKTRNTPSVEGTSKLGIHLRFGTVSIRELVNAALELNEHFLNELIWREFFMMILYNFPHVEKGCFKKKYENIPWRNDEHEFERWCRGETGYPIVDAGMRELNETGFMHNRVRMITAGFLTKDLLIDWRWGEAYFAEKLNDYELSSNNGNWQWAAGCGCDAAPYFRVFNPAEQTKKFDPDLLYVKKWIPDYSTSCLKPIVEHTYARKRAIETYKKALM